MLTCCMQVKRDGVFGDTAVILHIPVTTVLHEMFQFGGGVSSGPRQRQLVKVITGLERLI